MKFLFAIASLFLVSSCDGPKLKSTGGQLNPTQIPKNLDKQAPVGQKLKDEEMTILRKLLIKTVALPDPKLILGPKDESELEKKIRDLALDSLSLPAKITLQKILTDCTSNSTKTLVGEKKPGVTQDAVSREAMTGNNCPVQMSNERKYKINWLEVDTESGTSSSMANFAGTIENKAFVLKSEIAEASSIQNIVYRANFAGAIKDDGRRLTQYEISTGDRVIKLLDSKTLTTRSKIETLTHVENNMTTTEKVITLNINVRTFTFQLWSYTQRNNELIKEQTMFINGQPVAPTEFADFLKGY